MKLSIIISSYNTSQLLQQTINSIPQNKDWEIIVVDNNSIDDSVQCVKTQYPHIKRISNTENKGFATANNQGIKIAKGEYVLLLNSDTKIVSDAISKLIEYIDAHPKVGAITPKIVFTNGTLDPACHRGMPTPWRSLCYYSGLEKIFPQSKLVGGYHQAYLGYNKIHTIETTSATAMIVRKKTIDEIGLLDEQFFLYGEDLDWCKRITDAGWKIVYLPTAKVIHHKRQSGKKNQSKSTKVFAQNHFYDTMKQFYEKHYSHTYPKWLRQLVYLGIDFKKWQSTR